ncbi:MAG: TonB-dependent receptor, partial [Parvularculaceae bacterium]|nr:TonB-dependent receptor [Parvularculaceae bacterium]
MKKTTLFSGVALLGLVAGSAFAQPSTDPNEIIVSARKLDESLQDAPVSVTALTEQAIADRGITNIDELAKFSPGLSFSQAFGRSTDRPVVRGQSNVLANVQFGVESGTAYFVDGIYYPSTIQSLDLNMVKRVEVIRGPQSALYGRNSYAGAINFITKDPGERLFAKFGFRAAEGGEFNYTATAGGPILGDKLSALVSARYYNYDGQHRNELTNVNVGNEQSWSVGGVVNINPFEALKIKGRVSYQQDNDGPLALFLKGSADNNCYPGFRSNFYRGGGTLSATPGANNNFQYFCGKISPQPVRLNTSAIGTASNQQDGTAFDGVERELLVAGVNADWDIVPTLSLHSATGYRTETEKFGTDSDHSDANIFTGNPFLTEPLFANTARDDIRDWSQELRLTWTPSDMFRFLVGGFYYYGENRGVEITKTSGEKGVFFGQPSLGAGVTTNLGSGPGIDPGCTAASTCSDRSTTKNWAVFGMAEIKPTDKISVAAELRYMEETKGLFQWNGAGVLQFGRSNPENYWTPRITANYKFNDRMMGYVVWAKGVKPGGFNGTTGVSVSRPTYLPEKSKSYEIGFKTQWLDDKLTANISAYRIDASSVQLTTAVPSSSTAVTSIVTNQGEGRTWGMESEFSWRPSDNWSFTATYAFTNPKFTSGCDQDQWIFTSGGGVFFAPGDPRNTSFNGVFGGTATCDITGKRYPLTSKHQASVAAGYTRPLAGGFDFFTNVNGSYESSKFVQVHNTAETGDTFLLGAQLGIRGERWSANIFGRNITNEDTIAIATRWFDL